MAGHPADAGGSAEPIKEEGFDQIRVLRVRETLQEKGGGPRDRTVKYPERVCRSFFTHAGFTIRITFIVLTEVQTSVPVRTELSTPAVLYTLADAVAQPLTVAKRVGLRATASNTTKVHVPYLIDWDTLPYSATQIFQINEPNDQIKTILCRDLFRSETELVSLKSAVILGQFELGIR